MIIFLHRDDVGKDVDLTELTWEQKEQVLHVLFSKMNKKDSLKLSITHPSFPSIICGKSMQDDSSVFLTQL